MPMGTPTVEVARTLGILMTERASLATASAP